MNGNGKSRLKQNILIWGIFSIVYLLGVNTVFAGSAYSSLYSALVAIVPAFIFDRYLRKRGDKRKSEVTHKKVQAGNLKNKKHPPKKKKK